MPGDPTSANDYLPAGSLLNRWSDSGWQNGVQIDRLKDLQSLKIRTKNSIYELTVVSAEQGEVLVRGGSFFPELAPVRLAGSTLGGSFIKAKGVYIGFRMEFNLGGLNIVTTSPVEWIGPVEDPGEIRFPSLRES
ncbi:MAG TPA: hypothetical protein VG273_05435 [Bryobacteraceae bacterium]|jgi:hypothetical protein|nr:hypothetical protein [Bryobacteraceae bacterium]